MTLNELRYIVALSRERHFGRAAKACFVSQPTLSVAVRKLEHKLGATLFERRSGMVVATPLGNQVVAQAQRVLEEANVIDRLVTQGGDQLSFPLRLGLIPNIGAALLPHLVPELSHRAPGMALVLEESSPAQLAKGLISGQTDLAIVSLPFEYSGLLTLPLYREQWVVWLPADSPLAGKSELSLADLASEIVLLPDDGAGFREQILTLCPECNTRVQDNERILDPAATCSLDSLYYMVASGLGVTVVPAAAAAHYKSEMVCVSQLADQEAARVVGLAWRQSFPRMEALNVLRRATDSCQIPGTEKI